MGAIKVKANMFLLSRHFGNLTIVLLVVVFLIHFPFLLTIMYMRLFLQGGRKWGKWVDWWMSWEGRGGGKFFLL